ncbi:MAG: hypothetical protein CMO71_11375 [Verrucomicrobiales bacterium]|nr:hypothetical protein [Verrucomicrobiales bacterium]
MVVAEEKELRGLHVVVAEENEAKVAIVVDAAKSKIYLKNLIKASVLIGAFFFSRLNTEVRIH